MPAENGLLPNAGMADPEKASTFNEEAVSAADLPASETESDLSAGVMPKTGILISEAEIAFTADKIPEPGIMVPAVVKDFSAGAVLNADTASVKLLPVVFAVFSVFEPDTSGGACLEPPEELVFEITGPVELLLMTAPEPSVPPGPCELL